MHAHCGSEGKKHLSYSWTSTGEEDRALKTADTLYIHTKQILLFVQLSGLTSNIHFNYYINLQRIIEGYLHSVQISTWPGTGRTCSRLWEIVLSLFDKTSSKTRDWICTCSALVIQKQELSKWSTEYCKRITLLKVSIVKHRFAPRPMSTRNIFSCPWNKTRCSD